MRLYYLMLVVSTSVPTHVTRASGVFVDSIAEVNSTASAPSSANDSNNIPVYRIMHTRNSTDNEERMARLTPRLGKYLLQGVQKKILFTLYGSISEHKLTPASWRRVIFRDEKILRWVDALCGLNTDQNMYGLLDQVRNYIKAYRAEEHLSTKANLGLLMANKRPEDLIEVLKKSKFFRFLSFERVGALGEIIEELNEKLGKNLDNTSNEAKGPKLSLLETLLALFDEAKFASMLSAAKLSPFTGDDAKLLQNKLLKSWQGSGKTVDEVWDLLKIETTGLTYENLDTLVEYIALKSKNPAEARSEMLLYLKEKLGGYKLVRAIIREEKAEVQSAMSFLRDRYRQVNAALDGTNHDELIKQLEIELFKKWKAKYTGPHELTKQRETELFQKWKEEKMNPNELVDYIKTGVFHQWKSEMMMSNRLRQAPFHLPDNLRLERDHEAYREETNLELSLRPPGT